MIFLSVTVPSTDEHHQYVDRHHNSSINVLVAVGMTGRFYHCDVTNAGSLADGYTFNNSTLKNYRPKIRNGVMIADTAFKSHLNNLATRFSTGDALDDPRKNAYNDMFTRKRNAVERGIGQWKSRCRAMLEKMRFHDTRDSARTIQVAVAIHNWILEKNNEENNYWTENESSEDNSESDSVSTASIGHDHDIPRVPQRRNNRIITTSERILNNPLYNQYFP